MDVGEADGQVAVVGELEPGRDVRVVVELRDDDLVAGPALAAGRARESAKLSVVMFAPKIASSGAQPRKRAAVVRERSTSASVRRLVSYGPLTFAFDSRR